MNTSTSLKVTVNGKKYLITAIQKSTSCKDLLCAIAKATKTLDTIKQERVITAEKPLKALYSIKRQDINHGEENLLERLKGDRKTAGDYESLKVFNSLGKHAKIVVRESVQEKKEFHHGGIIGIDELSSIYKKRKKKRPNKEVKEEKITSRKHKNKKLENKLEIFETTRKQRVKHRSVDDSDIDSYKQDTLTRIKKRSRRVYDDSDIDVYQSLYHMVLDQTKQLHKIQMQSKEFRKTEWIKELKKTSQIYYIDDERTNPVGHNTESHVYDKDDSNDSGLPSPEYDSSESHENQPIKIQDIQSHDLLNIEFAQTSDQIIDCALKKNTEKDKQELIVNHNITYNTEQNSDNLQNDIFDQCGKEQNTKELNNNFIVNKKSDQKKHPVNLNDIGLSKSQPLEQLTKTLGDSGRLMSSELLKDNQSSLDNRIVAVINGIEVVVDSNRNIVSTTSTFEGGKSKMVAFDAALLHQKVSNNSNKKNDKKKIRKSDISEPMLLSPSTFKKHKSLKKVEALLGVPTADVVLKNHIDITDIGNKEKKEKEKKLNKKLKEIKKSKKNKADKSYEPEYLPKTIFKEIPISEIKEVLEFNVFEKKSKNKKSWKNKNNLQKNEKQVKVETNLNITSPVKNRNITSPVKNSVEKFIKATEVENLNGRVLSENEQKNTVTNITKDNTSSSKKQQQTNLENNNTTDELSENNCECKNTCASDNQFNKFQENRIESKLQEQSKLESKQYKNSDTSVSHIPSVEENDRILTSNVIETDRGFIPSSDAKNNIVIASLSEKDTNIIPSVDEKSINIEPNDTFLMSSDDVTDINSIEEEDERIKLLNKYKADNQALMELIGKILDYNLMISELSEELEILSMEEYENLTLSDLETEEEQVYTELQSVKSLLRSVADLTNYQRKEMTQNLSTLDQLDIEVRTKKAAFDNLRNGVWKTNSVSAPRSLIKLSKEKRKAATQQRQQQQHQQVDPSSQKCFV